MMNDCNCFVSGRGAGVARQPMDRMAACSNPMPSEKFFIFYFYVSKFFFRFRVRVRVYG